MRLVLARGGAALVRQALEGTNALITLIRTNGASGSAQVDLYTLDGNALANSDYIPKRTTINFASGQTSNSFLIHIRDQNTIAADKRRQGRVRRKKIWLTSELNYDKVLSRMLPQSS